jgi:hypothetical protein
LFARGVVGAAENSVREGGAVAALRWRPRAEVALGLQPLESSALGKQQQGDVALEEHYPAG